MAESCLFSFVSGERVEKAGETIFFAQSGRETKAESGKAGKWKRGRGNHKDAEGSGKEMIATARKEVFLNHEIQKIRERGKKWEPPARRGRVQQLKHRVFQ